MERIDEKLLQRVQEHMEDRYAHHSINTGLGSLDAILEKDTYDHRLIVLGGRPCMGKTSLSLSIVDEMCIKRKKKCLYFSPEYNKLELMSMLIRIHYGIRYEEIENKSFDFELEDFHDAPLWIDDTPDIEISQIMDICRKELLQSKIDLIVINCLQDVRTTINHKKRAEEEEYIIGKLGFMTRLINCPPVLVLSNLKRTVERRRDHRPKLSDLWAPKAINDFVYWVMLLYREPVYDRSAPDDKAEITLWHLRTKEINRVELSYTPGYDRFRELDDKDG